MPPDVSATWDYELGKVRRRRSSRRRRTYGIIVIFGIVRGAAFVPRRVITLSCVRAITKVTKNSRSCSRFRVVEQKERRRKRASERARRREEEGGHSRAERAQVLFCRKFSARKLRTYFLCRYIMLLLREYAVGSGYENTNTCLPVGASTLRYARSAAEAFVLPSDDVGFPRQNLCDAISSRNNGLRFIARAITMNFAINAQNNASSLVPMRDADFASGDSQSRDYLIRSSQARIFEYRDPAEEGESSRRVKGCIQTADSSYTWTVYGLLRTGRVAGCDNSILCGWMLGDASG